MFSSYEFWEGCIWTLICVLIGAMIAGIVAFYRFNGPGGRWDWEEWEGEVKPSPEGSTKEEWHHQNAR